MHSINNQKGITIVEVMISLTILGLVLGISYTSANRSIRNSRDAQERSEAYQYGQSIIDSIKHYSNNYEVTDTTINPSYIFPSGIGTSTEYCISTELSDVSGFTPVQPYAICERGLYGSRVKTTNISTPASGVHTFLYEVIIEWDNLASSETNEVLLKYQISKVPAP